MIQQIGLATKRTRYHVTVLSNFALAYDRYSRQYSKAVLDRSTFPDRFFLLEEEELEIGVAKASTLLAKLGLPASTSKARSWESSPKSTARHWHC